MAGWRDIKQLARATVHETFVVPAVYLTHATANPVRVGVRDHTKVQPRTADSVWAETSPLMELTPKVIFRKSEVPAPFAKAFVIFSATDIYRLGVSEPAREGYIQTDAVALSADECSRLMLDIGDVSDPAWEGILP